MSFREVGRGMWGDACLPHKAHALGTVSQSIERRETRRLAAGRPGAWLIQFVGYDSHSPGARPGTIPWGAVTGESQ
jgi:hypothetical protein